MTRTKLFFYVVIVWLSTAPAYAHYHKTLDKWSIQSVPSGCIASSYYGGNGTAFTRVRFDMSTKSGNNVSIFRLEPTLNAYNSKKANIKIGSYLLETKTPIGKNDRRESTSYEATLPDDFGVFVQENGAISLVFEGGKKELLNFALTDRIANEISKCRQYIKTYGSGGKGHTYIGGTIDGSTNKLGGRASLPMPKNLERWLPWRIYPIRAQREGRAGSAAFLISVNAQGRVFDCQIIKTSGHDDLDKATCKAVSRYARFIPAKNYNGIPTNGVFSSYSVFSFPSKDHDREFHNPHFIRVPQRIESATH